MAAIDRFYPKNEGPGRPTIGLERMLRMYVAQNCFGLSDEGTEDAIYDSQAIRRFVGVDLSREKAPDATTLTQFRHLLEAHQLTDSIFNAINAHLAEKGLFLRQGTVVDATIIAAPPSTKNRSGKRDPDMHQAKKGNQWHFGMKSNTRRSRHVLSTITLALQLVHRRLAAFPPHELAAALERLRHNHPVLQI